MQPTGLPPHTKEMSDTNYGELVDRIERGIASYRETKRERLNRRSGGSSNRTGRAARDLTEDDVPEEAWQLWQEKPDVREEYGTISAEERGYDGRSGDLAELIEEAASAGKLVELGDAEYEMESGVSTGRAEQGASADATVYLGWPDVVGVVGDGATIHYVGTEVDRLFNLHHVGVCAVQGVTFDISAETAAGHDTDVAVLVGRFDDRFWAQDVTISGQRNRYQDLGREIEREGIKEPVGSRHTWLVHMKEDGAGLVENLRLPDGEVDHSEIAEQVAASNPDDPDECDGVYCELDAADNGVNYSYYGGSIPIATDPHHDGLIVYKDCYVEGFTDNAFYMSYDPAGDRAYDSEEDADVDPNDIDTGRAVLWGCHAANVRGGCMRIGNNDTIVGGTVRMDDPPGDRRGVGLVVDYGSESSVTGLECIGREYAAELVVVRNEVADTTLDRLVVDADHDLRVLRCSSALDADPPSVTLENCSILDRYSGPNSRATFLIRDAEVSADSDDLRIHAPYNDPVAIQAESSAGHAYDGTLTVDGETYDASSDLDGLSLEDPRPLPSYGFDY